MSVSCKNRIANFFTPWAACLRKHPNQSFLEHDQQKE
jgi:hypothetical protein